MPLLLLNCFSNNLFQKFVLVHTFLMLLDLFSNIDALRALLVKCIDEVYPLPQWLKLRKGFYFSCSKWAQSGRTFLQLLLSRSIGSKVVCIWKSIIQSAYCHHYYHAITSNTCSSRALYFYIVWFTVSCDIVCTVYTSSGLRPKYVVPQRPFFFSCGSWQSKEPQ